MTAAELQERFAISRADWRRITADPGMFEPLDPKDTQGVTKWPVPGFVRWLAARHPELAGSTPCLLRPAGRVAAQYHGGVYHNEDYPEYFAGHWRTDLGRLVIAYPREQAFSPAVVLEQVPGAAIVVVVQNDWNLYGLPNLDAADRDRPNLVYEPRWSEVAAHIGTEVPWWPSALRRPGHLTAWFPAHAPEAVQAVSWPKWEPLYDMAYREAKGTPVRIACISIGHEIRAGAVEYARWELDHMNELAEPGGSDGYARRQATQRASMVIPAFPDDSDPAGSEAVDDEEAIRAGVAVLCGRTDDLAVECLEHIGMWSGRYMPFAGSFSVTALNTTAAAGEWIGRLRRVEPTAIHLLWEGSKSRKEVTGTFVDPVTNSPVVTKDGAYMGRPADEVSFHSYAPRRLPEGSRITEVVLDDPIWVRTQDGVVHPAPVLDAPGVSWGYSGSGPGTLATLVGALLDDGAAPAVTYRDGRARDESNLEAFLQLKHPRGTRLPRRLLENVRANGRDRLGLFDRLKYGRARTP
ncbi:hypothetical protein EHYA_09353 [Embleya hyalina]|uniref:Uncharacterized protein n=2 Tax=Embleya hyalina TaxID=516124 RepID=A0A401Z418_9ACTN|nr:hypothetical protein EHYA_09353 [Embleya hyalina]